MNVKEIFTKIHKSKTLLFNWLALAFPIVTESALVFLPEARSAMPSEFYFYYAMLITVGNKLLRASTTTSLISK